MQQLTDAWFNTEDVNNLLDPASVTYVLAVLLVFWLGKFLKDKVSSYNLSEQLTGVDNKAVAVSFMGFILALGILLWGVLRGEGVDPFTYTPVTAAEAAEIVEGEVVEREGELVHVEPMAPYQVLMRDVISTIAWGIVGVVLLLIGMWIVDVLLLSKFSTTKELVEDQNVGTGAVLAGAFVGTAAIIHANMAGGGEASGPSLGFVHSLLSAIVYFIITQLLFVAFSKLYAMVARYDLHAEIEKDNYSAGVSFGMTQAAIGIVLAGYLTKYDSFLGLLVWFAIAAFLLLTARYIVDKVMLPGHLLDEEIEKDQNWGAALVEGGSAIGLSLILIAAI